MDGSPVPCQTGGSSLSPLQTLPPPGSGRGAGVQTHHHLYPASGIVWGLQWSGEGRHEGARTPGRVVEQHSKGISEGELGTVGGAGQGGIRGYAWAT